MAIFLKKYQLNYIVTSIAAMAIVIRIAAWFILDPVLESDGLAYFTMAKSLADNNIITDNFGQHAFYSSGYPIFIAPFFYMFGSSDFVAIGVNLFLCALSTFLLAAIAQQLTSNRWVTITATVVYALWLPSVWNATMLAKENATTPLVLCVVWCALQVRRSQNPFGYILGAGVAWGCGIVTGGSSVLTALGIGAALFALWRDRGISKLFIGAAFFAIGALIPVSPWLYATNEMVGAPVLTTNGSFNLYLGNNPAATGSFVSISDTPVGHNWSQLRSQLTEVELSAYLKNKSIEWIERNPISTIILSIKKLFLFWEPNVPDRADFAASKIISIIRFMEVFEYICVLIAGLYAISKKNFNKCDRIIIVLIIIGFWVVHTAAYIIPRYRDPITPIFIVLASITIVESYTRLLAHAEN